MYQRDLIDYYRGEISLRKAIILTMKLPGGSQVWLETGGPMAWSSFDHTQYQIFHLLSIANWQRTKDGREGKSAPKPVQPPDYTHIKQAKQARLESKAERFRKKQARMAEQMRAVQAERDAPVAPPDQ